MIVYRNKTGVYAIYCTGNGKVYVGSSSRCLVGRWERHRTLLRGKRHPNTYLQHCWDKYGEDGFIFKVLEECEPAECLAKEQWWLDEKRAYDPDIGFNVCRFANGTTGRVVSEETRQKIRDKLLGGSLSDETKAKLSQSRKGHIHSPETKARISASNTGKKQSEQSIARISQTKKKDSPITGEIALWLRKVCKPGCSRLGQAALSKQLGISRTVIQNVLNDITWTEPEWYPVNRVEAGPLITEVAGT